jgi:acetyl esterase
VSLHPQAEAFVASFPDQPSVGSAGFHPGLVHGRRSEARAAALAEPREDVELVRDLVADGVPVRLYRPRTGAPAVLHLHGGGFVFCDLETHDRFCRWFANRTGTAVLAVDYRLAPEHPYPAPLDDCETAGAWLREHADELGVDVSSLVVLGDSAGGNLAAGLAVRRPDWFALQVLVYPCVDPTGSFPSYTRETAGFDAAEMDWFWSAYAPAETDRARPDVAPWLADPAGLPPAVVLTAEHDLLRDEGEAFADRLAGAGVPVVATRWQGMVHGFWRAPHLFDAARAATDLVGGVMADVRRCGRATGRAG